MRKIFLEPGERLFVEDRTTGLVSTISAPGNLGKPGLLYVEDPEDLDQEMVKGIRPACHD